MAKTPKCKDSRFLFSAQSLTFAVYLVIFVLRFSLDGNDIFISEYFSDHYM